MVTVFLPAQLQPFAGGRGHVQLDDSATVAEALHALSEHYPGIYDRVVTEEGEVRPHVNVFVGIDSIRDTGGLTTVLSNGSQLFIVPAVSGG